MTAVPPPRYRVVERDRRLIVIDTTSGQPASPSPHGTPNSIRRGDRLLQRIALAACGGASAPNDLPILTTSLWYDELAPRELALGPLATRRIGLTVVGLVLAAVVVLLASIVVGVEALLLPAGIYALATAFGRRLAGWAFRRWIETDLADAGTLY